MGTDPLALFDRIGRIVERRWRENNYDEAAFPELAAAILVEERPDRETTAEQLVTWLLQTDVLLPQFDRTSKFGQPPLTMYRGTRFLIDALFWMEGTTDIHQHGFAGAFQVLAGSSVHSQYRWTLEERVNAAMLLGDVRFERYEILRPGDTRTIGAGARLVHALFHLERPSVTIVVRTYKDSEGGPQYLFHPPSIAIDPYFKEPLLERRLEALDVLADLDPARYEDAARAWMRDADFLAVFRVARHYVGCVPDPDRLAALLDHARPRHGARVDRLPPVLEEIARLTSLAEKRRLLKGADHRFFLALLMNLPTKADVLRAIASRYPDRDPIELASTWVRDLASALDSTVEQDHTPIVFGHMLRGHAGEALITQLKEDFDNDDVERRRDQIAKIERTLSAAPMLRALFR